MTSEAYRTAAADVVYLAACALEGVHPDQERVASMDLEEVYRAADRHLMTGITAMGLENAGVRDEVFMRAEGNAIRKMVLFDLEKNEIFSELEKAGIWYMPLKGTVLKDYYPRMGMRQMSDCDILYDPSRSEDVRRIMEDRGFTAKSFGNNKHSVFLKPPLLNFEMHESLFDPAPDKRLYQYYQNVERILAKGKGFEYHFTPEDLYIYMIAHEYRHYSAGGTGLRSLMDTFVYCKKQAGQLDWSYINGELEKMGIRDFEIQNRRLAFHLFRGEDLTKNDREMLEYMISSGAFGTIDHQVRNQMKANSWGKWQYMWHRFLVPVSRKDQNYRKFARSYPVFYRFKVLLPLLPFYRIIRRMKGKKAKSEIRALRKH